jgi:hypothetical protein
MSYHKRNAFENRDKYFQGGTNPICKTSGCGKKLTPMEFLYSEYCFKCNQNQHEMKKAQSELFNKTKFTCVLFKWNSQHNIWEKIRTFDVVHKQVKDAEGEVVTSLSFYYRYDIFLDNAIFKTFYHYSPNKFD